MKRQILAYASPDYPWADRLHWFDTIDSTNDHLRALAKARAPHGTVVVAGHQSKGHGRMGRSFQSDAGMGVYLSVLLRPDCAPVQLMHLTCAAAAAMCDAVEAAAGFRPGIKWTNDLVSGKRKLGGILTELGLSTRGWTDHCIIGIGINCRQKTADFPPELQNMAASLSMVSERDVAPALLAGKMLDALARMDSMLISGKDEIIACYRKNCITIGQEISLVRGDERRHGTALDITDMGALLVRFPDGHLEEVNSGEVSVRGMYGYV